MALPFQFNRLYVRSNIGLIFYTPRWGYYVVKMVMRAGLFFPGMLSVTLTSLWAEFVNWGIAEIFFHSI
jgi:hypothetical protein